MPATRGRAFEAKQARRMETETVRVDTTEGWCAAPSYNVRIRACPTGYKMNAWCRSEILVAETHSPMADSVAALRARHGAGEFTAHFFWSEDREPFTAKVSP